MALRAASRHLAAASLAANGTRARGAAALLAALARAPSLHTLNLAENALSAPEPGARAPAAEAATDVAALCAGLRALPALRALSVAACGLRPALAARLLDCLPPSLTALNLSANQLGAGAAAAAAAAAAASGEQPMCSATHGAAADAFACALASALGGGRLRALTSLDASFNGLGPRGASALARALAAPPGACALRALALAGNGLGAHGARVLATSLEVNTSGLHTLDLAFNALALSPRGPLPPEPDARGLLALAAAATRAPCLTALRLEGNEADGEGAAALAALAAAVAANRRRGGRPAPPMPAQVHPAPMPPRTASASRPVPAPRPAPAPRPGPRALPARPVPRAAPAPRPRARSGGGPGVASGAGVAKKETRVQRFARLLLAQIRGGCGLESELRRAFGNTPDTSKALRMLVATHAVARTGRGGRCDPFAYAPLSAEQQAAAQGAARAAAAPPADACGAPAECAGPPVI